MTENRQLSPLDIVKYERDPFIKAKLNHLIRVMGIDSLGVLNYFPGAEIVEERELPTKVEGYVFTERVYSIPDWLCGNCYFRVSTTYRIKSKSSDHEIEQVWPVEEVHTNFITRQESKTRND